MRKARDQKKQKEYYARFKKRHPERFREIRDRAVRAYRSRNPAKTKLVKFKWNLRALYGMTIEQYEDLLMSQGGACAICKMPPKRVRLHVDHDHRTGKNRGLLCRECNRALGYLKDSVDVAQSAYLYLKGHAV